MKLFLFFLALILNYIPLYARTQINSVEQIVVHSYDSLRIGMIKTACSIGGITDPTFLKEISEGRVDSAIAHHPEAINKELAQLFVASDVEFKGSDPRKCDEQARKIRANLMGNLIAFDYEKESKILADFNLYKMELDSLYAEIEDYLKAKVQNDFSLFLKTHPNSKFRDLIPKQHKTKDADDKKPLLYFVFIVIALILLAAIAYLICELRKKNNAISYLQRPKMANLTIEDSSKINGMEGALPIQQNNEIQQKECNAESHECEQNDIGENIEDIQANTFANINDYCIVVGCSVIGNSHISMGLPCQDNCKYTYIKNGWGIAITSDGAGSANHSEIGSRIVVERGLYYFQSVIQQMNWIENNILPTEAEWTNIAYTTLKAIKDDLEAFAKTKNLQFDSLSATIIVVIHTPLGFLTTHIGDGRAGYKDDSNEWRSLIQPHKGEEANQTIFLTSDFWKAPYYVMSGVMVPESHVVHCRPLAFTLMSDGCEHTAWQCNLRNEQTGIYYDPNKPFEKFFNPLVEGISKDSEQELKVKWPKFIKSGNKSFKNEPDDKTMILGIIKNKSEIC
ncbi:MAG: PP2C family serine/threonine-protein phosphatase [bacterium]|nr:PP2C family serine/threonine-protein phosphatase [bacterium]